MSSKESLVKEFIAFTGSDEVTALHMLEACSNDFEAAVATYVDGGLSKNGTVNHDSGSENVRAPIPQKQGVLVEGYRPPSKWTRSRTRNLFGAFHPFDSNDEGTQKCSEDKKLKRLEDLFRPPHDIMHVGTFETARNKGTQMNKWLIVNIQNIKEFSCQALNRDVWSNKKVKDLIKQHFIFWQEYSDTMEGERFMNFYTITEWPHVSIVDPRTGGRLTTLRDVTADNFLSSVNLFLANHGTLDPDSVSSASSKDDILNSNEDAQLAAAIALSLKEKKVTDYDVIDCTSSSDDDFANSSDESEPLNAKKKSDPGLNTTRNHSENGCGKSNSSDGEKKTEKSPTKTFKKIFPKKRKVDESTSPFKTFPASKYAKNNHASDFNVAPEFPDAPSFKSTCNGNSRKGSSSVQKCRLMLKNLDGTREKITMNASDTLEDLAHFVSVKYKLEDYELVTNFPRKNLSTMPGKMTLEKAGLCPQETIFIQNTL